jgi:hypothetical protein
MSTIHKTVVLDVRVDCAKYVADQRQRTIDREVAEIERIISSALRGRGYIDVEVVAAVA